VCVCVCVCVCACVRACAVDISGGATTCGSEQKVFHRFTCHTVVNIV